MEFPTQPPGIERQESRAGLWLALGVMVLVVLLMVALGVFFTWRRHSSTAKATRRQAVYCEYNLRNLARGMKMYAQDFDGRLPAAAGWADSSVVTKGGGLTQFPVTERGPGWKGSDYAFNSTLSRKKLADLYDANQAPLLFESNVGFAPDGSANVADPLTSFLPRHSEGGGVAYADGHVAWEWTAPTPDAGLTDPDAEPAP